MSLGDKSINQTDRQLAIIVNRKEGIVTKNSLHLIIISKDITRLLHQILVLVIQIQVQIQYLNQLSRGIAFHIINIEKVRG